MAVNFNFSDRRVLVTGGARGLGLATVLKFAATGAKVFALDRDATFLQRIKDLSNSNPNVHTIQADIQNWADAREKVKKILPFHHLVNNAGALPWIKFSQVNEKNIDELFSLNFKPMINLGQLMAESLQKNVGFGGTIVNVSSIADERVIPGAGMYCCSKAAITMLSKTMALELSRQGIRVNTVKPGVMDTSLYDKITDEKKQKLFHATVERQIIRRALTADECAEAILFLSSDSATMITGTELIVDGGYSVS